MRHIVVNHDRFIEIAIRHEIKQRAECFVLHDVETGFCRCQARLHITIAGNGEPLSAIEHFAAFVFQSLDGMLNHIDRILIDKRPHHRFSVQRIANRQTLVAGQKFIPNF